MLSNIIGCECGPDDYTVYKDALPVCIYFYCSRPDVDNRTAAPPTLPATGAYPHHQLDPLSPSVKSAPSALQYDPVRSGLAGEELHRPPQMRHTDPEPKTWITDPMVSYGCNVTTGTSVSVNVTLSTHSDVFFSHYK